MRFTICGKSDSDILATIVPYVSRRSVEYNLENQC
jgi:hypothetical protein